MEDTSSETEALGRLLRDHGGGEVAVLDLRRLGGSWTDFFVVATCTSETHMGGLERHLRDFCQECGISVLRQSGRPRSLPGADRARDGWRVIDLGHIVVHLMDEKTRAFYDLERLYG